MGDRNKKREEVTDPALLEQLNSEGTPKIKPISELVEDALSENDIPISKHHLVKSQIIHETGRPDFESEVAKKDNNVTGITWDKRYFPEAWKGTPRPSDEGGYYVHFPTYTDWGRAYTKLLKKDRGAGKPIDADTVEDYAHRLKKNGYYKDPESVYVSGMKTAMEKYGIQQPQEVTDPALLAQLNSEESAVQDTPQATDPQKKSPSENGLDTNLPQSHGGSSGINTATPAQGAPALTPADPITGIPQFNQPAAPAPIQGAATPVAPIDNSGTGERLRPPVAPVAGQQLNAADETTGLPILREAPPEISDDRKKTQDAAEVISENVMNSASNIPHYNDRLQQIPMTESGNPVYDLTNPHGSAENTAQWGQFQLVDIERERQKALEDNTVGADNRTVSQINDEFKKRSSKIKSAIDHTVDLQLYNREHYTNKSNASETVNKLNKLEKEKEEKLSEIDNELEEVVAAIKKSGTGLKLNISQDEYASLNQKYKDLTIKKFNLEQQYGKDAQKSYNESKYNPIMLGAKHAAISGDKIAQKDFEDIKSGKQIDPERQYKYNQKGDEIIKIGIANTADEKTKKESEQYLDKSGEKLFQNNKIKIISDLANARYKDENHLIFSPSTSWTADEVEKYGKQQGISDYAIKELQKYPTQIPKSASDLQLFLKGSVDNYAPIWERTARGIGRLGGVPSEMVNADFPKGWENKRGPSSWIVGETPSEQNSFHNTRGAIGQVIGGLGGLIGLVGEVGVAGKIMGAAGVDAAAASKLANFGVMAFNGYNDAYHNSAEIIGDKPEDESKRQAYAAINGLLTGAIFSINPQTKLLTGAFGLKGEAGDELVKQIEKSGGLKFLESKEGKNAVFNYTKQFFKDNGTQVGLSVLHKVSEEITDAIANPSRKQNIAEDLKETAITTALAMSIPSLFHAAGHVRNQSPLSAAQHWELGENADTYRAHIDHQVREGSITPEAGAKLQDQLSLIKNVVADAPKVNVDGDPLTPNQVKDYAYKRTQEEALQKEVDNITERATANNSNPDKVQVDNLKKKISDLQKQREEIFNTPIPPAQTEEQPVETENPERSVATKSAETPEVEPIKTYIGKIEEEYKEYVSQEGESEEDYQKHIDHLKADPEEAIAHELEFYERALAREKAEAEPDEADLTRIQEHIDEVKAIRDQVEEHKKNKEETTDKSKENVSLDSKTSPDEKSINEQNDGQSRTEDRSTEGSREDSEIRQAASLEGSERPEDRQLTSDEKNIEKSGGAADTQQPPEVVSAKKRRKFVEEFPEEQPVETENPERSVATDESKEQSISPTKISPEDASIQSEEQQQESVKSGSEQEHARVEQAGSESASAEAESSDSLQRGEKKEEVITESISQARLKEIDLDLKRQHASQKLEGQKRSVAEKSGDIAAANKANDNWYKKQERIDRLNEEREELVRKEERAANEEAIRSVYRKNGTRIKELAVDIRKGGKGMIGSFPLITPEVMGKLVHYIGVLVEKGGNLHVAIHRAIEKIKGEHPEVKISTADYAKIRKATEWMIDPIDREPVLSLANEEIAKDWLADIHNDVLTHPEAVREIMEDADISDKAKNVLLNYLDWHLDPANKSKKVNKVAEYSMTDSGLSEYIGAQTTKDIVGEDKFFDSEDDKKNAIRLTDMVEDASKITRSYSEGGDPASVWGKEMLDDIKKVKEDPKKQVTASAALHIELQGKRFENQRDINALDEQLKSQRNGDKIKELQAQRLELINENNKIERLIGDVQNFSKRTASTASDVLNARRLDRMLRDDILKDYYHERILSEQEVRRQQETQDALDKSIIEDYKNHPEYKKNKDEQKRSAKRKTREASQTKKTTSAKEKIAKVVKRITGKGTTSKEKVEKAKIEKEEALKKFPRDENGNIMTPQKFIDYIKKLKNPC